MGVDVEVKVSLDLFLKSLRKSTSSLKHDEVDIRSDSDAHTRVPFDTFSTA